MYTSKTTQHKLKLIAPRFDKKHATLLWFASGFVRDVYCRAFCQSAAIRRSVRVFHRKSAAILGLRHFTRRHTFRDSVRCGAHRGISVVHGMPC